MAGVLDFRAGRERRGEARRAIVQIVEDENLPYLSTAKARACRASCRHRP
ncbi:MAG: hypothetical protein ACRDNW_21565 [Trebonia sp.]